MTANPQQNSHGIYAGSASDLREIHAEPPARTDLTRAGPTRTFGVSLFRHKRDNNARLVERTWAELCSKFQSPTVRAAKDGPLFSPAAFGPPLRAKRNVKRLSLLVLDLDHAAQLGTIKSKLHLLECGFVISSTHSHLRKTESNPDAEPRFRVVIPLAEPIPAARFFALWSYVKNKTGLLVDEAAKDESRVFYTPAIAHAGAAYECFIGEGPFLNWERLPLNETVPEWNPIMRSDRGSDPVDTAATTISNGSRNQGLFKIGKRLADSGVSATAVRAALLAENVEHCRPPLPPAEVESIAANAMVYPMGVDGHQDKSPIPLPTDDAPVPELSHELLPSPWREWLSDVSDRLQCPLDYAAVAALVAAASIIGNRIRIRPKRNDPWLVVPNLWGAIVGPPGVMKTPAVNEGLTFFRSIADGERRDFEERLKDAEFDNEFNEAKKAELIKEMKKARPESRQDLKMRFEALAADEPVEKRLWTADSTIEKLGVLLDENPDGILILRDELTGWLKSLDRPGREQDRAFYLEAWNGEGSFTFDRIGRGKTHVKNLTLSLLGTIQPAMLQSYIKGSVEGWGNDGLIQRFQVLVYPAVAKSFKYKDQPPRGREEARGSFEGLYSMTPKDVDARFLTADAGGHAFLQFDEEAQEFFQSWLTDLETDLRSGELRNGAVESHMSKYRSLMPTLALIFHLLTRVSGASATPAIELDTARLAAAWCSYLQRHAEKLYRTTMLSDFGTAREVLRKIEGGELDREFTARDIYAKCWKNLSDPSEVKRALELLAEYRHLEHVQLQTGGRAKSVYLVNDPDRH